MRISKQELLAKGQHTFEETITYDESVFSSNPFIKEAKEIKAIVKTENVSELILLEIKLEGNLILLSTRSLLPVDYHLKTKDKIVYSYNKDLVDNEEIFLLEDDLDLDKIFYSMIISSIPLKIIAKDDKESISGDNWEVITEDEYLQRKKSEDNSPFALLKDLDLED